MTAADDDPRTRHAEGWVTISDHIYADQRERVEALVGEVIETAFVHDQELHLVFLCGTEIAFADQGQSCCESRYMTCDDDLESFRGDRLVGADVLPVTTCSVDDDHNSDVHEIQFLHVRTSGGTITCQTHNEHNGYYGGFSVCVRVVEHDLSDEGAAPPPTRVPGPGVRSSR